MVQKVFYNGLADIITLIAGIVSSITLAKLLGPEQWGQYSQVTWLIASAGAVFGFGLTYATIRYLGAISEREDAPEAQPLVAWLIITQFILAISGAALLFFFSIHIVRLTRWQIDPLFIEMAAVGLIPFMMIQMGLAMLRGLQLFRVLSLLGIVTAINLLLVTLITFFFPSVRTLILASIVGQLILLPWLFKRIWRPVTAKAYDKAAITWQPPNTWYLTIRYSSVMFLSVLLEQIVWQKSEIFFLAQLEDPSESGYYSIAYTIALLGIGTVPAAITGTLTPIFSSLADTNNSSLITRSYEKYFSFLNLVVLPLTFGLFIIAPYLLETLYGKQYILAAPALRLLAVSSAIGMYTRPSVSVIHAFRKPKVFALANLIALPVDLILAWQLIPGMGSQGAAIANLSAQLCAAIVIIGYTTVSVGLRYDMRSIGRSIISTMICGLVAWFVAQMVSTSGLGVLLAVVFGGISYMVTLVCLRDRPTREMVIWIQEKVRLFLNKREQEARIDL